MPNSRRAVSSRKHLLVALLAFSSLTSGERAFAAGALPSGGSFAAGAGSIAAAANGVNVTQSTSRGVINWQSFSIGQGNTVNIANGSGATLNRVTGGDISSIAGSLTSTGSVYVINQAGVLVTPTGTVNTVGTFVASTRDIADSSFMAGGAQNFVGNSTGTVVNQGSITSANGDVVLVGKSVSNSGQIAAANGDAILAAGDNVVLQPAGGDSQILISAGSGDVTNAGTINAAQAELNAAGGNVYALASNNGGIVRASGTTLKDGHVYLTAGDDVTVDGAVAATNADGSGGAINVTGGAGAGTLNVTGSLNASATGGAAKGGTIVATAATVNIGATANIAANGAAGGMVLLGGDRHGGSDPSLDFSSTPVANAQTTTVAAGAQISADGGKLGGSGNGGNVVVWSDQQTSFAGAISAQGGATGGNGGFVEVSGKQQLSFTGAVTTAAPFGTTGTLLLDPADVTISSSATSNDASDGQSPTSTFSPTSGSTTSNILNTDIQAALGSNDVTITTTNSGTSGAGTGNITVNAPITWATSHSLTLTAAGTITFGADADSITATGAGNITLNAAGDDGSSLHYGILVGAPISTTSGIISLNTTNTTPIFGQIKFNDSSDTISSTTGDIDLTTKSNIIINANITSTSGGNINLVSTGTGNEITVGNLSVVQVFGAGSVLAQADYIHLGSGPEGSETGQIKADTTLGKVTVQPATTGTVYIGDASLGTPAPPVLLNDMDVALITTGTLVVGSSGAPVNGYTGATTTALLISDNLSVNSGTIFNSALGVNKVPLATVNNLELLTGSTGYVTENAQSQGQGQATITVGANGNGGLAVVAGTYIDLSGAGAQFSDVNRAGTVALKLTGVPTAPDVNDGSPSTAPVQFGGDATTGSLTIGTVNGVSGINAPGAAVYLANAGNVIQASPIIAASLDLEGAGAAGSSTPTTGVTGTYTLTNASNAIGSVSGNVSSLTLYDSTALTQTGTTALTGYGTGTGVTNASVQIADPISITLDSGSTITNAAGGDIQLETSGTFTSGASTTLSTTGTDTTAAGGHWRVYSQNPANDSRGVLDFGYIQYNTPNSATAGTSFSSSFPSVLGTGNGLIYAIQPTASLAVTATRQYDTTTTALNAILNFGAVSGTETGDTVLLNSPTGNGTFNHPNVAGVNAATTVSVAGVTLNTGGTLGGEYANNGTKNVPVYNYAINSTASGAGAITAVDVTAVGTKIYDGSANAPSSTFNSLTGVFSADSANVALTASTAGTLLGTNAPNVGSYSTTATPATLSLATLSLTLSGAQAGTGNYVLSAATYTVTAATLTISGAKTYDGHATAPLADINTTTTGATAVVGLVGSDSFGTDLTLSGTGTTGSANAATYTGSGSGTANFGLGTNGLILGGSASGNYTLAAGTFTISPATLTITPKAVSVVYDGSTLSNTTYSDTLSNYTISGLQNGETTITAGISLTGSMAFAGSTSTSVHNATTYSQAVGSLVLGSNNSNYTLNFTNPTPNNYVITPATLTISGQKTYDTAATAPAADINQTTAGNFALTGLASGDAFGAGGDLALSGTGVTGSANAGTYTGSTPPTSFTLGGLTLGAGTNGDASGNYILAAGTFKINAALLTVTTANGTRAYDGTTHADAADITLSGLQGSDATGPGGDLSLTGSGITGSPNTGTYTGATGPTSFTLGTLALDAGTNGNASGNYTLQAGTFIITAANLTITPKAVSVVYDGSTLNNMTYSETLSNYTISGLQNGETTTSAGIALTGSMAFAGSTSTAVHNATTYSQAVGTLGLTSNNSNYTLNFTNPTPNNYVITPATLTLSGAKTYDGQATAPLVDLTTITGIQSGDSLTAGGDLALSGAGVTGSANVGTYTGSTGPTLYTLGGLTLGAGTGGNASGNYTLAAGTFSITAANLTITASPQSKVYGTTTGTLLTGAQTTDFTTSALPNSESVSGVTLTATPAALLATTNAGTTGLTMTPSAATGGGTFLASNYNITYDTGAITITPAQLTASGTKAYDGTVNFSSSNAGQLVLAGGVNGQTVTLSAGGTATSSSPNANSYTSTTFTPNGFTVTGGSGTDLTSNYQLPTTAALTISPAALTITASPQSKVYGTTTGTLLTGAQTTDFTTSALPNSESVSGVTLTATPAALLATTNAGTTGLTMTPSAATGGGTFLASNYNITYDTGAITITPAQLTASGTKAYDGTVNFSSSNAGQLVLAGGVNGQTVTLSAGGTATSSSPNANSYTSTTFTPNGFTVTGGSGTDLTSNYQLPTTAALTINPAALTITPNSTSKTYGTLLTFAGTEFTSSGLENGETIGSVTLTSAGTPTTASVAGSPYTINGSNASGGTFNPSNYSITYNTGTLTVNPLSVSVTGTRTYNGTPNAPGSILTVVGEIPNDPTLTLTGTGTVGSPNVNPSAPITSIGTLALTGTGSSNYVLTGGSIAITPAPLSITANNQTKTYGSTLTFAGTEFTSSGLQGTDTVGSVTLVSPGTPATASVAGSPYVITPSAATGGTFIASNYTITYNPGTLTVNPLGVTVIGTRTYNGTPNAPGTILTVVGEIPGDPTLTMTGTGTLQTPNVNSADPITSLGTLVLTGTGSSNYVLNGGTVAITPAALTITANNQTKTYGTVLTFAGTEFTSSGLQGGDTIGRVTLVSPGAPATAAVAGSPYAITPSAATGGTFAASNYTIRYVAGTLTINPLAVTVTGTRLFDGGTDASGTILTVLGEIPGDPTLTLSGIGTLAGPDANATPTPITALGTLALVGPGSTNYVLTSGSVLITAPVTQVNVPDQTSAGAGVQTVGVFTNGILLPRPQQNGVVGGQFATGAGCEDSNTQCDVPTNGAAAAEATGTQSGTELISGKNSGKGS